MSSGKLKSRKIEQNLVFGNDMIDKNNTKYKKLVAVAEKEFWFTEEIKILEEKHYIAAFILAACRLEGMCYKLACKIKSRLTNNTNLRFQDKELERLTFGRLLEEISKMNLKIGATINCEILSRIYKVVELRNAIVHNLSKNIDIGIDDIEGDIKNTLPDAKRLYYEIWKNYANNPNFLPTKSKIKK